MLRDDLNRFNGELLFRVLGKHSHKDVVDNLSFGFVKGCDLDKYVSGMDANLGIVPVDDWG